jgi:hypothetical protein
MTAPAARIEAKAPIESKRFRIVFTNSFALRFNDNDVLIRFSIDPDPANPAAPTVEEVGVVMTPRSVKLLAHALTEAIGAFEAAVGPISVPQEKLDSITESLRPRPQAPRSASTAKPSK